MKILKIILIFLMLTTLLNFANAADVRVKVTPVQDVALPGSPAVFDIEITNLGGRGEIKAVVTDFNWRKDSNYGFYTIEGGGTIKDTYKISPSGNLNPGIYSVNIRFYATANPEDYLDQGFTISVVPYESLVDVNLEYNPQGLSPDKENLVILKLKNKYKIELDNLNFKLRSEITNQDFVTNLGKQEEKDFPFSVILGNVREGDYEVNVFGLFKDKTIANATRIVKVAAHSDIKESKKEEFSFLVKTSEVSRINNGNTISKEIYTKTVSSFENLFTKSTPEPTSVEKSSGAYKYVWQFTLNPNDSYVVITKTNYGRPILNLLILALLIYVAYGQLNRGLKITKKVLMLKSSEGHIIGLKVLLILKNSGAAIKHIRLSDTIPGLLELPHEYGTLKPSSIKHSVVGSYVMWDIPELIKGEERVLSYKMKSKVTGLGKLNIPRAVCRYKDKDEKLYITRSNSFNLI